MHGADVDAPNHAGSTPTHAAAANRHAEAVRCLLLEGGASGTIQDELSETAKDIALRKVGIFPLLMVFHVAKLSQLIGGGCPREIARLQMCLTLGRASMLFGTATQAAGA